MPPISSRYTAKKPDVNGYIAYTQEENETWQTLFERQQKIIVNRACDEFCQGVRTLNMTAEHIPQLPEMNSVLSALTGWSVQAVEALIPAEEFFELLSLKRFPAATFIRAPEELDYLQEPDIFHEFFGHCSLLTHPIYAEFTQNYAIHTLKATPADQAYLRRLYWFTIEFGLMQTAAGLRTYGGGILSSKAETVYAVESPVPIRRPLGNALDALRTPYRIDILQPVYYVIDSFDELFNVMSKDLVGLIHQAQDLGDFPAQFDLAGAQSY
jgi:phenylalanine-4-hydroxylase